jgi:hypothetical protein
MTNAPTCSREQRLESDFSELAARERVQDHHRRELERRQLELLAQQRACDELDDRLSRRWAALLAKCQLVGRAEVAAEVELARSLHYSA